MNAGNKNHLSLIIWIVALIAIGGGIGFRLYGYSGRHAHFASLPKDKSGIDAHDSLFILDFICKLLKLLNISA